MALNLRNRNFLKLLDFTPEEIKYLLNLAADLKKSEIRRYGTTPSEREKYCFDF